MQALDAAWIQMNDRYYYSSIPRPVGIQVYGSLSLTGTPVEDDYSGSYDRTVRSRSTP